MKNLLRLIIDAAKNDDMNRVIELAENQQDRFCDNNCVWTDHHPECVYTNDTSEERVAQTHENVHEPEWYNVIDVHGCNRFYHRTEDCPYKVKTPLYTTPQPEQKPWAGLTDEEIDYYIVHRCGTATKKNLVELIRLCEIKLKEKNT